MLSINLHDIDVVYQWGDFKNGVDLLVDDNEEYFVLLTHGQSYEMAGEYYSVAEAFMVLPYNEEKHFLNVVSYVFDGEPVKTALNQF